MPPEKGRGRSTESFTERRNRRSEEPVRGKKGGSVKREESHGWNLTAGEEKEAAVFHGEAGDRGAVLVSTESEDIPTKITLKGPDGLLYVKQHFIHHLCVE